MESRDSRVSVMRKCHEEYLGWQLAWMVEGNMWKLLSSFT